MKIIYMKNKKEKWVSNVPKVPREEKRQWMNIENGGICTRSDMDSSGEDQSGDGL